MQTLQSHSHAHSHAHSHETNGAVRQFDGFIFDMDGLLVDSEIVWFEAEAAVFESRGFAYTDEVRSKIVGLRVDTFLGLLRDHFGMSESVATLMDEVNQRMLDLIPTRVVPQPGAAELLQYVVEHNIPRAMASNSPMSIIDAIVEAQGWGEIFQVRCSGDDEPEGKPAPYVYLTAARKIGIPPSRALGLEDSVNGAKAVVAAGMTCYAVPDLSHATRDSFAAITPHVFDSLHEVLTHLRTGAVM